MIYKIILTYLEPVKRNINSIMDETLGFMPTDIRTDSNKITYISMAVAKCCRQRYYTQFNYNIHYLAIYNHP